MNINQKQINPMKSLISNVLFISILALGGCKSELKIDSLYKGQIAEKGNIILNLSSKEDNIVGFYYNYCDSLNKTLLFGEIESDGKFVIKENNTSLNTNIEIKGKIEENGSIVGDRINNNTGQKETFLFAKVELNKLSNILCPNQVQPKTNIAESNVNIVDRNPYKKQVFSVSGRNLDNLKQKIELGSKNIMSNGGYSITNSYLNMNNLSFSCTLTPDPNSSFIKIGLYYGPTSIGYCESCANVINKNPGSVSLVTSNDNAYFYEAIALSK
jgi:hypothetical protein